MYRILRFISWVICFVWCRFKPIGKENIPDNGPVLLVCNHTHALDAACILMMTKRQVHFMCKQELFGNKLIGWALTKAGSFPVDRDGGGAAGVMKAMRVLKNNEVLCIFPEGTRNREKKVPLLPLHKGVAMLEIMSHAPIVPCWVNGHFSPVKRSVMLAGKPMDLSEYASLRKPDEGSIGKLTGEIEKALLLNAKNMETL